MSEPLHGRGSAVAYIGAQLFADELSRQGASVEVISWQPPTGAGEALERLAPHAARIAEANDAAVERMQEAHPTVVGVGLALDTIPGMDAKTFLHAGPPIDWPRMSGPLRGGIIGAAIYEGLASDPEQAERLAASDSIRFSPCNEHQAVGPMAGVITPSMPVWIVENDARGNRSFATFNEGLGKVLRYGAYDEAVIERLRWIGGVAAHVVASALAKLDEPLDLQDLLAQALQMGDEGHNRNRAATSLLLRKLLPGFLRSEEAAADLESTAAFISGNDHFFLNLSMAAAKVVADAASGIDASSIVTTMARNGTEFGIRLSGTGERWFTGPAGVVKGLYMPGFGPEDAALDIGDSTITETVGLGGFAMAAAPAIVGFVGGSAADAVRATESMYDICWSQSQSFRIPALGFRGSPLGIDCREVVHTGLLPVVNTGIAHREAGIGQIGAGLVEPPIGAFVASVEALAELIG